MTHQHFIDSIRLHGRTVTRIGLGMGELTRRASSAPTAYSDALALLRSAQELGITHFDSAHFYGNGLANEMLRTISRAERESVFVATKVGALSAPGSSDGIRIAQRPEQLRHAVDDNLSTLGVDALDLVYLRRMDFEPGPVAVGDQQVALEDQLEELVALRDQGKILEIGLSNVDREQVGLAAPAGIACIQNPYNVLDRTHEAVLTASGRIGAYWAPFFPRGGGPSSPRNEQVEHNEVVRSVALSLKTTPSSVALAWQLAHSSLTLLIPGTSSIANLRANASAANIRLDDERMRLLDGIGT